MIIIKKEQCTNMFFVVKYVVSIFLSIFFQFNSSNKMSAITKCKVGNQFDCECGDDYFKAVDEFQQTANYQVLEFDADHISQVISHQSTNDQRLCNRLVKLYDIVAGYQEENKDVDIVALIKV